jgi:hypothetical protein
VLFQRNSMLFQSELFHAIPCYSMLFRAIPCCSVLYIPCYSVLVHAIPPKLFLLIPSELGSQTTVGLASTQEGDHQLRVGWLVCALVRPLGKPTG